MCPRQSYISVSLFSQEEDPVRRPWQLLRDSICLELQDAGLAGMQWHGRLASAICRVLL